MEATLEAPQRDAPLLISIAEFCRRNGIAESTFGRRAVNDGKFVARLRDGARITPETLARVSEFLVRALGPGGRLLGIHSCGNDPGMEIVRRVRPDENPFQTDRHDILRAVFRYDMHTLPTEVSESIGTSTLFAAWNAAVYVAQIDDERLAKVIGKRKYLDATRDVLQEHGGLWFLDESYVVSRKRD